MEILQVLQSFNLIMFFGDILLGVVFAIGLDLNLEVVFN